MSTSHSNPIRYAIYTRQSVEHPSDFSSCEAQFAKCQSYAERAGQECLLWVGQRFDDEGESGGTLNRPALTRLRALAQSGGVDRIYVTALDRLARRVYDMILIFEELEQAGVKVHLAQAFSPPDGAQAKFMRNVLAVFAEFERDMIASRIAETRAYLKRHGRRIAGPAPFGYTADPATKQLVPVPKEARRVRMIFKRALSGQTPAEIALRINHLKWRTKTWLADRSNKHRGGGKWTARQVIHLLRNPVYVGQYRDTKGPRPGCHKPIVDKAVFDQVQAVLDRRRTITNPKRRRAMRFPLRGKIICPKCGRRLSTTVSSSLGGSLGRRHYRFYCCRSHSGGRAPCKGARYPAYELEEFVRRLLGRPATWRNLLPADRATEAERFSSLWSALGYGAQDDLMVEIIETVAFRRKNTEIQITFKPQFAEIITR